MFGIWDFLMIFCGVEFIAIMVMVYFVCTHVKKKKPVESEQEYDDMKTFPEDGIFVSDDDIELSKAPRDHTFSEKPLSNLQKDNTELSDETTLTEEPSDWSPNYLVAVGAVNEKSRHLAPPPSYRERTGSTQFRDDTFLTSDDIELESTSYVYQPRYSYPRVDISSPIGSDVSDKSLTPVDSSATHLTRKERRPTVMIKNNIRYSIDQGMNDPSNVRNREQIEVI